VAKILGKRNEQVGGVMKRLLWRAPDRQGVEALWMLGEKKSQKIKRGDLVEFGGGRGVLRLGAGTVKNNQ